MSSSVSPKDSRNSKTSMDYRSSDKPLTYAQKFMITYSEPKKVIECILTKQGSKELQKALNYNQNMTLPQKADIEQLVDFLVDKIQEAGEFSSLLADQYGNYFCQKLFQRLKDEHKMKLLMDLTNKSNEYKPKVP